MKKGTYSTGLAAALMVLLALTGCSGPLDGSIEATAVTATVAQVERGGAGPVSDDPAGVVLLANQNEIAGYVNVANDQEHLYVTFRPNEEWCIVETHVHVANGLDGFPLVGRWQTPAPGLFDYKNEHDCVSEYQYAIGLDESNLHEELLVAAHAALSDGEVTETAWAAGTRFSTRGNWATYFTHAPMFVLDLDVYPEGAGSASGAGLYPRGEMIELTAIANEGFVFVKWADENGAEISDDQNHLFTMPGRDTALTAVFKAEMGRIVVWPAAGAPSELLDVPDYDDFIAVAAGTSHAIGLRSDGSLMSWGRDTYGQISGTPDGTGFVAVDAGLLYTMALHEDGTVYSWGGGLAAQAANKPSGTGFAAIGAGYAWALGIASDGSLDGWSLSPAHLDTIPAGNDFVAVRASDYQAIAVRDDGSVALFGRNTNGAVGLAVPEGVYRAVSIGYYHAAGVLSDGSMVSWGRTQADSSGLVRDFDDGPYVSVAAGRFLGLGLRADGSLAPYGTSATATDIPTEPAGYIAVAVSPDDSALTIQRASE